jgi:hypothetical protein
MPYTGPLRIQTVRGTPFRVYGRILTPIVRVVSVVKRRATIRTSRYQGGGWGAVWVRPLAIVDHDGHNARTMLIPNRTATVLRQMVAVALVIPILCLAVISIARRIRDR